MPFDLILRGGRVIDPSQKLDAVTDVAFAGGKVAQVGQRAEGRRGHGCPRRLRLYRHPGPDRPAHPCLLGRHLARHRRRGILPHLRRHHRGRYRQRRPRQFRRLPQACDRAEPGAHSRLSARLACRHLRLLQPRHGRRERGTAADGSDHRGRGRGREPRSHRRHQGAGRPSRLGHLGHRAARDRARGRRTGRHALDVPYRPSAADLRGGGRRGCVRATC